MPSLLPSLFRRGLSVLSNHRTAQPLSMSLVDISLSHADLSSCKTQQDMVSELAKSGTLQSNHVIDAFRRVDRALYIPTGNDHVARYAEPYENAPQKLFFGATISSPHHHAIVTELLADKLVPGSKVLDFGCGSGYLTAVFAHAVQPGGFSLGTDRIPSCVDFANEVIAKTFPETDVGNIVQVHHAYEERQEWSSQLARNAPFDAIHVGFAIPNNSAREFIQLLTGHLAEGGKMVAPVEDQDGVQQLTVFSQSGDREEVMSVLCQPMEDQQLDEDQIELKSHAEQLEHVQHQLEAWKSEFEAAHARKPSRQDMMSDPNAVDLFKRFADLRKRVWT